MPHDVLVDVLSGDHPPADPSANLKVLVSRARRVVGEAIRTGPGGYRFDPATCTVDADQFLATVGEATGHLHDGDHDAAGRAFHRALDLWTGEPLPEDLYEPWAEVPRRRLLDAYLVALEGATRAALASGEATRAVSLATEASERAPLREGAHVLLAHALVEAGDRPRALAVVRALIDRTAAELGLDPSPSVARLQADLLAGDEAGGAVPDRPVPRPRTGPGPAPLPLAGRDAHVAEALAGLGASPPRPVVVRGPAGSGTSRLLVEVAARLDAPLAVTAHPAERDQDGSLLRDVVRGLAEAQPTAVAGLHPRVRAALATLVPELVGDPAADLLDAPSRRSLQTEGTVALLEDGVRAGITLVLDDLPWADPTSLRVLTAALARVPEMPVLVGHRSLGARPSGALGELLDHLRAGPVEAVDLSVGDLTLSDLDAVAVDPLPRLLLAGTDGSPFAVTHVVTALRASDLVTDLPDGRLAPRPDATEDELASAARAGHERSLRRRVDRQPTPRREILEHLALMGRAAPARLLALAVRRDADAVADDLDELTRGGLVAATDRGGAIVHERTAEVVRAGLDAVARRRRHRDLARALAADGADAGEVAVHLGLGGAGREAATAHARAAADRLGRAAIDEAVRHADAGLALVEGPALRRELLRTHADATAAHGDLARARADLREALRTGGDGPERAGLLTRLAMLSLGADDMRRSEQLAERALLEAGDDAPARARALAVASVVDMNAGRPDRARERADTALALYRSVGDAAGVAGILDARAMAGFLDGDVTGSVEAFDRVATAFEDAGQLLQVVTPRSTRGHAQVFAAAPEAGLRDVDAAAELAGALGHREGVAYTAWHRSEALTALGRVDDAVVEAERAVATATAIGHRGWTATGNLALGLGRFAAGDDEGAVVAFEVALGLSDSLPLFAGWAAARLARVHLRAARVGAAAPLVRVAMERPPPLGRYEARLAEVELLLHRAAPGAAGALHRALDLAERGGHAASAAALDALARVHGIPDEPSDDAGA